MKRILSYWGKISPDARLSILLRLTVAIIYGLLFLIAIDFGPDYWYDKMSTDQKRDAYMVFRITGTVIFLILGYRDSLVKKDKTTCIVWVALACVVNPFIKLHFEQATWAIWDVFILLFIVGTTGYEFWYKSKRLKMSPL